MRCGPGSTTAGRWGVDVPVVDLVPTEAERTLIGHLGPDPLRDDWDAEEARRRLAARPDVTVRAALLDQRPMAGLGNLWANEVGFLRGVHRDASRPRRPGETRRRRRARPPLLRQDTGRVPGDDGSDAAG
nr:hypothetical protein GCM10025699_77270 [Microbacterium flavescens]